jgi:hypothetical protein
MFTALLFLVLGLWVSLGRAAAVRRQEEFQRYLRPKTEPYDANTRRNGEMVYGIAGALFVAFGVFSLLGLLSPRS